MEFKLIPVTRNDIEIRVAICKLYKKYLKTGNEHLLFRLLELGDCRLLRRTET